MAGMSYQNQMAMSMSPGSGYVDPRSGPSIVDQMRGSTMGQPQSGYGGSAGMSYGGSGGMGSNARVDAARSEMYGLARGNLKDLKGDPVDSMVRQQLMNRANGGSLPYDQATQNAMLVHQANMASAAQQAQASRVHGNPNDPSYRAAMSQLNAQRQGSNQDSRLNIAQNANVANYNAQGTALSQLGQFQGGYHDRVTGASNYLSGLLSNETADSPSGMGAGGGGGYTQTIGQGGRGGGAGGSLIGGSSAGSGFENDDFFKTRAGSGGSSGMVMGTARQQSAGDIASAQAYDRKVNGGAYPKPATSLSDWTKYITSTLGNAGPFHL